MENGLNSLRQRARDAAHRAGLPRFWRWWSAELAPLIPLSARGAMRRRLTRRLVEFGDGTAILRRPELVDGELRLVEVARVALSGDPSEVAAAGRAALSAIATAADGKTTTPKVVVALPERQVMRKTLVLPAAVEENLEQALSYDLDRHTPFRPEQLYFDAAVIDRNPAAKTITVDWVAALKTAVDSARRQVEDWGGVVVAVVPGPVATVVTRATRLNLLPHEGRPPSAVWRRWQLWMPAALVVVGALAVLVVPLLQKREYAIALNKQTESAREQAEASDALRAQLERQQGDYNYALAKKYAYPGVVHILDDITRLLPDDTWITQLEIKSTVRGKDTARELVLRGESSNAGALIGTLEESKLVEQAALQSPTTKLQPGPGEVFVLGARLRSTPLPEPVPVTTTVGIAPPSQPPPEAASATVAVPPSAAAASSANAPAPPPGVGPPPNAASTRSSAPADTGAGSPPVAAVPGAPPNVIPLPAGGAKPSPPGVNGRS